MLESKQKYFYTPMEKISSEQLEKVEKIKPLNHSRASQNKKMPHFAYFPPPEESDPCVFVENTDGEIRVFSEL